MNIIGESNLRKDAREKTSEFIQAHTYCESYRQQWDERAVNWYKQLVGYREKVEDGRSNLHIPRTYQIVDTIRSRIIMSIFRNRPYIEFIPIPSHQTRFSMQQSEDKAKIASSLLDEQLEKNNIVAKYYDYVTSGLTFPCGVLGVGWRYEEDYLKKKVPVPEIIQTPYGPQYSGNYVYQIRENMETVWDDNEIVNIDYFDFWVDPKGSELDDCRFVFQREFVTRDELLQRLNFLDYLDEGVIYLESIQELDEIKDEHSLERGRDKRMAAIGLSDDIPDIFTNSRDEGFNKNTEFEILHYWEDDRHAMVLNKAKCIYDGPSPYWRHRKKPFTCFSYERLPNEFYGMSAVQIISDLQEEENTIHNQRTDNVNFILNKMWKVRRGADIDESELVSQPHGIIYMDRLDDVQEMDMKDVAASGFQQQNIISSAMENALGANPIMQGATASRKQTATETMRQTDNAGMRFDVKIKLFKSLDIKRLAYLMDMNNQQFINENRMIKLGEGDAIKWRNINPGELIGEFDYRPASANIEASANKDVLREQLTHMMQFMMQAGIPFINYHELIKEWLKSFDFKNAEKFIIPKEQWEMQQMMMAQAQQQTQGQNRPTEAQQAENAMTGRARGRRPQTDRNPKQRPSGMVR